MKIDRLLLPWKQVAPQEKNKIPKIDNETVVNVVRIENVN